MSLRITKWLINDEFSILNTDFTLFLTKESPTYVKGRKADTEYRDSDTNELVAKKTFTDIVDANTSHITGISITIDWYSGDNSVGLTKTFTKPISLLESENLKRNRRVRAMDYLKASAKGSPIEPYMVAIFDHYAASISRWYDIGGLDLYNEVLNEADPTISAYLAIELAPSYTVKDGILFNIS